MYRLFPRAKAYFVLGCALTILFVGTLAHDRAAWHVVAAVAACGISASWFFAEFYAVARHHSLLLILYRQLQPRAFIDRYTPLLEEKKLRPHVRMTMLAYLSNGYAALGDWAEAERLLSEAAALPCAKRADSIALLAGNRCAVSLARGDTSSAQDELARLDGAVGAMRPGKKRRLFDDVRDLRVACLSIANKRCTHNDAVFLERRIKLNGSALYRLELELWLALGYLALDEADLAEPLLKKVAAVDGELWIQKRATGIIKELSQNNQ